MQRIFDVTRSRPLGHAGAAALFASLVACGACGVAALGACGAVLGIEDPVALHDGGGGDDATTLDGATSDVGPPAPCTNTCVDAPPAGWDGPFAYFAATGGPPAPAAAPCGGDFPSLRFDGSSDLIAPAATCSCECGAPSGIACAAVVNLFSDNGCTTPCGGANQPVGATCTALALGMCPKNAHVNIAAPAPKNGSCAPNAAHTVTPPAWSTSFRLCAATDAVTSGACAAGKVCSPRPELPQQPGTLCVAKPGDETCPPTYPTKKVAYASFTDDRACSACTCDPPTGATCSAETMTGWDDAVCTAGQKPATVPSSCANFSSASAKGSGSAAVGGTCAPHGGDATGEAKATTPTTICCSN